MEQFRSAPGDLNLIRAELEISFFFLIFRKDKSGYVIHVNHVSPKLLALYFSLLFDASDVRRRSENFYCHKFRVDKIDMVDVFRNIFYYLVACYPAHQKIPNSCQEKEVCHC